MARDSDDLMRKLFNESTIGWMSFAFLIASFALLINVSFVVALVFSFSILVAFGFGKLSTHFQKAKTLGRDRVCKILSFTSTCLAGAFLGAMTAYNSGIAQNDLLPSLTALLEPYGLAVEMYVLAGFLSGLWTGFVTSGVLHCE